MIYSGGEEVLLDVGGQDSTEAFEDVGHSDEAREILDGLLVGTLKRQVRHSSLLHLMQSLFIYPLLNCKVLPLFLLLFYLHSQILGFRLSLGTVPPKNLTRLHSHA